MNTDRILKIQKNEITDHIVYKKLSELVKDPEHRELLLKMSGDEMNHYRAFKKLTGREQSPDCSKIFLFVTISRFMGLNFGLKLMESAEESAQDTYEGLREARTQLPEIDSIIADEETHENEIISLLNEEHLKYIGSIVLGLNDALVELTAALAGFTLALQNGRLIGVVGLITGIAASMSMAASEYLSMKQEETNKSPIKSAVYTLLAYIGTVMFLVTPFFLFGNVFLSLGATVTVALLIILVFTFYISVAKGLNFKKRFLEMAGLSLGIAIITFFIGLGIRKIFGIDV